MNKKRNFQVGKLKFNIGTKAELVKVITEWDVSQNSMNTIFWGAPMVVWADRSVELTNLENQSDICAADGAPISRLAKKCGLHSERCGGPDIMDLIIKHELIYNKRHYFYGSTNEVLALLKQNLTIKYPNINIVGMYAPPFEKMDEKDNMSIVAEINECKPDYLWVCLGAPKQEKWVIRNKKYLKNMKIMAVGAAFNFYAGTVKRAPKWMQKSGIEWIYRLLQEPSHLWRRYILTAPKFLKIAVTNVKVLTDGFDNVNT